MHRLYPCICGFKPIDKARQVAHRAECKPWQSRSHPDLIRKYRKSTTLKMQAAGELRYPICKQCDRPLNAHASSCRKSRFNQAALEVLHKNDMDPFLFEMFLRALARKYGHSEKDASVFCLWAPVP
jgi:hypothetical protein